MIYFYICAIIIVVLDQLSKYIVVHNMLIGEQIAIIDQFFYLTSHRNSGAAWGMLQGQMFLFYIITVIVIVGIIYYAQTEGKASRLIRLPLSLILGGAIGNFIDRLINQEVVDFLDFVIFGYDFPIFNIADSALVCGVILLFVGTIIYDKKEKTTNA